MENLQCHTSEQFKQGQLLIDGDDNIYKVISCIDLNWLHDSKDQGYFLTASFVKNTKKEKGEFMKFKGKINYELEINPNDIIDLSKFLKVTGEILEEESYIYLEVNAEYSGYYDKGKTYGPMEECYPPEFDIEVGTINTVNGINIEEFLNNKHIEELTDYASLNWQNDY